MNCHSLSCRLPLCIQSKTSLPASYSLYGDYYRYSFSSRWTASTSNFHRPLHSFILYDLCLFLNFFSLWIPPFSIHIHPDKLCPDNLTTPVSSILNITHSYRGIMSLSLNSNNNKDYGNTVESEWSWESTRRDLDLESHIGHRQLV